MPSTLIRLLMHGFVVVVLLAATPAHAQGAADADQALLERYRDAWMARERGVRHEADRIELTRDLLAAARAAQDDAPDYAVLICRRVYTFGSTLRETYPEAAEALRIMSQIDPSLKIETLEKARDLYDAAYRESPSSNLGMGIKAAEATGLVAREREHVLHAQLTDGRLDPGQVLVESNRIAREWEQAYRTAMTVMHMAENLKRQLQARRSDQAALVTTFLARHRDAPRHYQRRLDRANQLKDAAASLNQAHRELEQRPESITAQARLGRLYLTVFDAPAMARPYAPAFLDGAGAVMLNQASKPDNRLDAAQRLALAQWYAALAERAEQPIGRRRTLVKARALLAQCNEVFDADDPRFVRGEALAVTLNEQLGALDVDAEPLAWAPRPAATADASAAEPDAGAGVDQPEQPAAPATAPDPRSHGEPQAADASDAPEDAAADDPVADQDDAYWANREKSIFDFGRD